MANYHYASERLGFRSWVPSDLPNLFDLCSDDRVMKHFPKTLNPQETKALYDRLVNYELKGCTFYATEILESKEFIGFIGLAHQEYDAPFTPCYEIGWRLKFSAWGQGYATEGASKSLKYGFEQLKLPEIIATCTLGNQRSEHVMNKIGMTRKGTFLHPKLSAYPAIQECLWYSIQSPVNH